MGQSSSKHEKCSCCEWHYSHVKYKNKGELCNQCDKYYTDKPDTIEGRHNPGSDEHLDRPHSSSKKCDCCELFYDSDDIETVIFECRINGHKLHLCINCGTKRAADSLTCPFPRSRTDKRICGKPAINKSLEKIAKKRSSKGRVEPIGKE